MSAVDHDRLRVELARLNMTKRRLAHELNLRPSTLSTWLHGASRVPEDLSTRIETALGLKRGSLAATKQSPHP